MGMMGGNPFFGGAFGGLGIPGYGSGMMGTGGMGMTGMTGMIGLPIGGIMNSLGTPQFNNQREGARLPNQTGLPGSGTVDIGMGSGASSTGVGGGTGGNTGGRTGLRSGQNQQNQVTPNGAGLAAGGSASLPCGARVSADVGTNSLIVVAPASIQPIYKKLIESLDQRRPQVLIEAKIIAIDTTDGFSLGVETSMGDRTGLKRAFKFTSYGLSKVNPITGALEIIPAQGFNGTVVDPEVADLVIQALSTHSRSRVVAEPKIVVNDNQTGTLESLVSISFPSLNTGVTGQQSQTVGGTQEAGTTINVTPQINEDDNLQLEFDIEFSSFGAAVSTTIPPPRQIQTISSVITIPDGQTVIVGGLKRIGATQTYAGIPWIEKIPIVRDLTGITDESNETISYFVFIRPLIMRDSRFQDLQYVSDKQAGLMGIPSQYPGSQPLLMR
jgi:general secretion pathway protein D